MNDLGGTTGAQKSHLAVISGGGSMRTTAVSPLEAGMAVRSQRTTGYNTGGVEGARSRHETNVRAIARSYDNFEDALLPMVQASGVAGRSAIVVAETIRNSRVLRDQAERAFQRARMELVQS